MRSALLKLLTVLLALAFVAGACAKEADDALVVEGDSGFETDNDLDETIDEPIAPDTGLDGQEAPTSDEIVQAALSDVDAYWSRTYERFDAYRDGFLQGTTACDAFLEGG